MSKDLELLKRSFSDNVKNLQNQITDQLKKLDPKIRIVEDQWTRKDFLGQDGGGGITRAFEGNIFENAGVNTSEIFGCIDPQFAKNLNGSGNQLWAAGISLIIHPVNPKVPTVHANFRMIQQGEKCWFGGGADLTPYYPYEEDFSYFHQIWKDACKPFGCYEKMKKECDDYFVNHHRGSEMRGIGGIFFDHFNTGNLTQDHKMVSDLSDAFIPSYFPLVSKRKDETFNNDDIDFQLHRRGRYVEFNLLHDRGTLFGLKTNGRIDSILISLPARCKFSYQYQPNTEMHQKMLKYYYPQQW